jgi:DNA-binding NarL/FixJ family response regulator
MHVAVLEPREVLRVGLGVMVERIVRVERVDSYRDVDELVDRTTRDDSASPDIVIVSDAVTEVLRKHCPDTRVLEIIDSLEPTHLAIAATTEADGYLVLPEITESMLDGTLQALMRGELPIARPVASYLRDRAQIGRHRSRSGPAPDPDPFQPAGTRCHRPAARRAEQHPDRPAAGHLGTQRQAARLGGAAQGELTEPRALHRVDAARELNVLRHGNLPGRRGRRR